MFLQQLVQTSRQVAATAARLAKIDLLAALLQQLPAPEIETAIAYLSGSVRQSKLGAGRAGDSPDPRDSGCRWDVDAARRHVREGFCGAEGRPVARPVCPCHSGR